MSINLNLLFITVVVVLILCVASGYKKGAVKEIIAMVSLLITSIVVILLANGVSSYVDGKIFNVILVVILLAVVGLVRHLLGVVFFSAKLIAKLPIVSWLDKLLGIAVGVAETVLLLWTLYTFIMLMDLGTIGQMLLQSTQDSKILTWFFEHNYLAGLVEQLGAKVSTLQLDQYLQLLQ